MAAAEQANGLPKMWRGCVEESIGARGVSARGGQSAKGWAKGQNVYYRGTVPNGKAGDGELE